MTKIKKLKICNWSLLFLTVAILVSGIQLEATHSEGLYSVWIHIVIGLLFMGMVFTHIYLHFGKSNWFSRFHRLPSQITRILWWVSLLTLLTGVIAMIHWAGTFSHAAIGGVHGKLGFVMVAVSIGHIVKRIKFFKNKKPAKKGA